MRARARFETRLAALGAVAVLANCGADERALSFELGTSMGSATAAPSGGKGNAGASGRGGKPSSTPGESGDNAGGAAGGAETTTAAGGPTTAAGSGGTAGNGGNGTSGSADSGGTAGSDSAGQPAAGAAGAPFDGPCGDLNRNLVDDCSETLVQNSRFDSAVTGWAAEGSLEQTWVSTNAQPGMPSGSLSLRNTTFIAGSMVTSGMGSRQCLVAWGDDTYEFAARVFIKPGQGSGAAAIDLVFYGSDGCDGTVLGGKTAASVATADAWQTARGLVKLPAGTRSAWVRLVVGKPLAQSSFEALFDDVLVTKK